MAAQTNISTDQSTLLALKARITNAPQSTIMTNWSAITPVCNWVGVTCGKGRDRTRIRLWGRLNLKLIGRSPKFYFEVYT